MSEKRKEFVKHGKEPKIFVRHEPKCQAPEKRCRCTSLQYRAEVWNSETKRPRKSPTFDSIDNAKQWRDNVSKGVEPEPVEAPTGGTTVGELMGTFFAAARAGTALAKGGRPYRSNTVDKYEEHYGHHVERHVATKPVAAMDTQAWQLVVDVVMASGRVDKGHEGEPLSLAMVNSIFAVVRAAYRWATHPSRALVPTNPLRDIQIARAPKSKRKRVAPPEIVPALLGALKGRISKHGDAPNPGIPVVWAIMFYTGLRISEACALDWPDVDLKTRWLTVGASKSETGTERRVPILPELHAVLTEWQRETGAMLGPICPGARTFHISPSTVDGHARKRWPMVGMDVYAPHEARHTFASVMAAKPHVSLPELQEWLGHASLQTTAIYVKTLPGFYAESVHERIGAFGG